MAFSLEIMENGLFFALIRSALWGSKVHLKGQQMSTEDYHTLMNQAKEQAIAGLLAQGLMDSGMKLVRKDVFELFGIVQQIKLQNARVDEALSKLCLMMKGEGLRFVVVKGQTIAVFYRDAGLRQSGDIDFYVPSEDFNQAYTLFQRRYSITLDGEHSDKHAEFELDGVSYELHWALTDFANPKHQKYWDSVVMPIVMVSEEYANINGSLVPVLPPTENVLYTFVHLMHHLFLGGVGLRQFCDLAVLIHSVQKDVDREGLEKHLNGIGMKKAFCYVGAVLVDVLGLPNKEFPFSLDSKAHKEVPKIINNLLVMGNFGHNVKYTQAHGPVHAMQYMWQTGKQIWRMGEYAPAEARWVLPNMMKSWGNKLIETIFR